MTVHIEGQTLLGDDELLLWRQLVEAALLTLTHNHPDVAARNLRTLQARLEHVAEHGAPARNEDRWVEYGTVPVTEIRRW